MSYPTYSDLELEIQNLEEENKKLKEELKEKQQYYSELEVFAKEHWFDFWAIDC